MYCKTQYRQTVIPIFYDVDPSELQNQKESFAEAFAKHESKYRDDVEGIHKVKRWRTALSAAADLKGYDIRQGRIIATTRDKHLIRKNDAVYEVTLLVDHQAIQLFNQHAFKKEVPNKSFEKLTLEVHFPSLRKLDLSFSDNLIQTLDFTGMPNLEYLNLIKCTGLEEVHQSLEYCAKLIQLHLHRCISLMRFPCVNVESLDLQYCSSLEKFPEIVGRMKPELDIHMGYSGIIELPSFIKYQTHITKLNLSSMKNLVALPSSICKLKDLVKLQLVYNSKLESFPEEIGGLVNLEKLDASRTLISRPPSSIVRLNKLKILLFGLPTLEERVFFVFPHVNEGLHSLEILGLSECNLIDGGLSEHIGCLHSLKELYLNENNFEHLPRSITQLGALQTLHLSYCKRLTQLPEFPQQLDTIYADLSNDSICNSLFQNISSLQHDNSLSVSLSLRVFTSRAKNIPS
uniref:Bacterial spot disease resistance protein 4 n=1 Tax=Solanum tuberosum TaxID=4113 RepID=M1CYX9_SOLTU